MGSERPIGGVDYPRTYQEFRDWFAGAAAWVEQLARLRSPDGFLCSTCGGDRCWRTTQARWMCADCGGKTSVTAGMILPRWHTPIRTRFAAAWLVTAQKTGVSAVGLQRVLGFGSQDRAWAWLHQLRRVRVRLDRDPLAGVVELDQAFLGGQCAGRKGAATGKVPVMIAVERVGPRQLGRVRLGIDDAPGTHRMLEFATATIAAGSSIHTDEARVLRGLATMGYRHRQVSGDTAPDIGAVLPGVHLLACLLKPWLAGTLQHQLSLEHLPYYLDEYTFRFHRRASTAPGMLFYRLQQQAVATDAHPLTALIAK